MSEPRLDGATNGTTAWYLAAEPTAIAMAEMAFLNGQQTPSIQRVETTNILGLEWGIVLDVGCAFIEHRGFFRARGA